MKTVEIGFVGCGYMGQIAHLANFATDTRCRIAALAELRPKLAKLVADRYSIPKVYSTHLDLLEKEEVDAIVEITPDDLHAPVALDAIKEGKHVYTEKPISTNVEDARTMVNAAKKRGVIIQISYMKRYDPGVELAKAHVSSALGDSSMGEVTYVRSHGFGGDWIRNVDGPITTEEKAPPFEKTGPRWMPDHRMNEYRNYLNVFCHNINLVRHLVGDPESARFCSYHKSGKVLLMEYDDFPAVVETGWLSASFWDEQTQVYFRDGRVTVDTPPPLLKNVPAQVEIYHAGSRQAYARPLPPAGWSFRLSARHFIDCILEGRTPRSSGEDSLVDVQLVEDAFRAVS